MDDLQVDDLQVDDLQVDVLFVDDLQEELLVAHNLLGKGTVDIDEVELHILDVGAGLHREVWLQAAIHNNCKGSALSLLCNKSTSEKMQYSICINRAEQRMHYNNHKSNYPYYILGSFFMPFMCIVLCTGILIMLLCNAYMHLYVYSH